LGLKEGEAPDDGQGDVCVLSAGGAEEGSTGMLVVEGVVPGGPADGVLEPGDVLVGLEGRAVVHFQPLEALLDACVGGSVAVEVERGGRLIRTRVQVSAPLPATCLPACGCAWSCRACPRDHHAMQHSCMQAVLVVRPCSW
jgi:S1-C subfamily serine protease